MERKSFVGTFPEVLFEASEFLECSPNIMFESYNDGDFDRTRYFERLGQRHATVIIADTTVTDETDA